jgi:sec-independent protein translocase protein TatB
VGSGEILVITLIALVVLGPEKLPKLAADIGRWVGRARAMARQLRSQLDQEVHLEEMRRIERSAQATMNAAVQAPTPPAAASESAALPASPPAATAIPDPSASATVAPAAASPAAPVQRPADGQP